MSGNTNEVILNHGTFEVQSDAPVDGGGVMDFLNYGLIRKNAGTGNLTFACDLFQYDSLEVHGGSSVTFNDVQFANNSYSSFGEDHTVTFSAGTTLNSTAVMTGGHRYVFSGSFSSSTTLHGMLPAGKQLHLNSGYVYFHTDYATADTIILQGTYLRGTGSLTGMGIILWTSGQLHTHLVIAPGATCRIQTPATKYIDSYDTIRGKITIHGDLYHENSTVYHYSNDTISIESTGAYYFQGGLIGSNSNEVIFNKGLFELQVDASISGSGLTQFINEGMFLKTGGSGNSTIDCQFFQYDSLDINTGGTIYFDGMFTDNNAWSSFGDAHVTIGNFNLANGSYNAFGENSHIQFNGTGTLDTTAIILGGHRYIFAGSFSTSKTVHATLPPDKQMYFNGSYINFDQIYTTTDTVILQGAYLRGTGSITGNGIILWTSGHLFTHLIVGPEGVCRIQTTATKYIDYYNSIRGKITIHGDLYHENSTVYHYSNDTISIESTGAYYFQNGLIGSNTNEVIFNKGLFELQFDGSISGSGVSQFINEGMFRKSGESGNSTIDCQFYQYDSLDIITGGSIYFDGMFTDNNAWSSFGNADVTIGKFHFANGSYNSFGEGNHIQFNGTGILDTTAIILGGHRYIFAGSFATSKTVNATLPSNKQMHFNGSYIYFNQFYTTADTVILQGAYLRGTGSITGNGIILWTSGQLFTHLIVGPEGSCRILTTSTKYIDSYNAMRGKITVHGDLYHESSTVYHYSNDTISIESNGAYYFQGGHIAGNANEVIFNKGLFELQFDGSISGSGVTQFINEGMFRKTGGSGNSSIDCQFFQYDSLDINTGGSIYFDGMFTDNNSWSSFGDADVTLGNFHLANGSYNAFGENNHIQFNGAGTIDTTATILGGHRYIFAGSFSTSKTINATLPPDKQMYFNSSYVYFNKPYATSDTVILQGAYLRGKGILTANGIFLWKSGQLLTHLVIGVSSVCNIQTSSTKYIDAYGSIRGKIDLYGTIMHESSTIYFYSNDTISIHPGGAYLLQGGLLHANISEVIFNRGLFDVSSDIDISGSDNMHFINYGQIRKTGGTGVLQFDCQLFQYDTIEILSGSGVTFHEVLFANGSWTSFGADDIVSFTSNTTLDTTAVIFGGYRYVFTGSFSTSKIIHAVLPADKQIYLDASYIYFHRPYATTDSIVLQGGILRGNGSLTAEGVMLWKSGSVHSHLLIASGATCRIQTPSSKYLESYGNVKGKITISGELHHENSTLYNYSNDTISILPGGTYFFEGGQVTGNDDDVIFNMGMFKVLFDGSLNSSSTHFINHGHFVNEHNVGTTQVNMLFMNYGTIAGIHRINFFNLINNGIVNPGLSAGTLTLLPAFNNTNSKLLIEIQGNNGPGTGHDFLNVEGPVTLADTLEVSYLNSFIADTGYCYTVLETSGNLTGMFDALIVPDNDPKWKLIQFADSVVLEYFNFTCPQDITVSTDANVCDYTITGNENNLITLANCYDSFVTNSLNGSNSLNGEILPQGETVVTWTVDDGHGNTGSCQSVITVEDKQAPEIVCPPDATRSVDEDLCYYTIAGPEFDPVIVNDNCQDFTFFNNLNAADTLENYDLNVGPNLIIWTVDDQHGQSSSCVFTVTVEDNETPQITCPSDITLEITAGACDTTYTYAVIASDNCDVALSLLSGFASNAAIPIGEHEQIWEATDGSGNSASCQFTVTVNQVPVEPHDTICVGDSIFLAGDWQYDAGIYIDTFINAPGCDSVVITHLATTTECYWPGSIVYIDSAASGANTGVDWANAYIDLQLGLDVARRYLNVTQIWIARGTYYPTNGTTRSATFGLVSDRVLLGGFAGTETDTSQRDPLSNPVILSGDIGATADNADNSYHILTCPDTVTACRVDGIAIANGNANGPALHQQQGAALYNSGMAILQNCTIRDCSGIGPGSVLVNAGAQAHLLLIACKLYEIPEMGILNSQGILDIRDFVIVEP